MSTHKIIQGDCVESLRTLPDASVHCCVTSPPYWGLRDYGHDGQIGLEATPEAYVARMVEVFREVRRVLRDDGTCWLNLGDSYCGPPKGNPGVRGNINGGKRDGSDNDLGAIAVNKSSLPGIKHKDLVGIPWRVAFALQADGWWLRQDIIWHKPNPMPESVRDRCTKAHEYVFLLTKSERYFYDADAVSEPSVHAGETRVTTAKSFAGQASGKGVEPTGNAKPGSVVAIKDRKNKRSVWRVCARPYSGAHFAVMPPDLVEPCILAGCPDQCCPVCGAGYARIVEKGYRSTGDVAEGRAGAYSNGSGRNDKGGVRTLSGQEFAAKKAANPDKFLGWQPACDCAASGTIPGTVLDPFAGSGTTLAVAAEFGRSAIGCELNPEYIALAERRIKDARSSVALFEGVPA